jgi:PhnB protein
MKNTTIEPYLFFGGRCEEAIAFYREGLGAKVEMILHHKDSPMPAPPGVLQAGFENKVMHASLRIGGAMLMMSDGCDDKSRFDGFRLSLAFPDEVQARRAFEVLSAKGSVQMPLGKTFWSPCFGMVTDQFNVGWMITVLAEPTA